MPIIKLEEPKTNFSSHYHYSNRESQGTLLNETRGFPEHIDTDSVEVADGYFDRIRDWHKDGYETAAKMIGGLSPQRLKSMSSNMLKFFAKAIFERADKPEHVRIIYYFNVASGYDCPYIMAIFNKKSATGDEK